jgi:hypothetical protein
MRRLVAGLGLALSAVALAGCQLYWIKRGATTEAFTADHQACVQTAAVPHLNDQVLVNLDLYRACLRARGWQRETGSTFENPPGYFRGQENEGPVRLGDVPKQVPTSTRR